MKVNSSAVILITVLTLGMSVPALAQNDSGGQPPSESATNPTATQDFDSSDYWEYEIVPYFWFSEVSGKIAVADREADVSIGTQEPWRLLNLAFSIHVEASKKRWAGWMDFWVTNVEDDETLSSGQISNFKLEMLQPEIAVAYRAISSKRVALEALGGGRFQSLKMTSAVGDSSISIRQNWFDPIVGLRYRMLLGTRWPISLRGDVGGFGIGADLSWTMVGTIAYQTSARFMVGGGYRFYSTKFETGSGLERFLYDVDQAGPMLGFGLLF